MTMSRTKHKTGHNSGHDSSKGADKGKVKKPSNSNAETPKKSAKTPAIIQKKIVASERVLLALVDHRNGEDAVNKAAYYAGLHAKKNKERLALLYVREPAAMQLFGVSDVMRQESKEESAVQLTHLETQIQEWFGKKPLVASYVREGEVTAEVAQFITKNRFVSKLVVTSWQLDNIASGLYGYISGAKMKSARSVPVVIIPENLPLTQINEIYE